MYINAKFISRSSILKFNKVMKNIWFVVFLIFIVFTISSGLCAEPKKVAVVPFTMNATQDLSFLQNGLFDMLSTRLSDPGKVVILDRETIEKAMESVRASGKPKDGFNENKARIIGQAVGVDYILFGSLTNFGQSVSLDTSMVDLSGEKPTLTFFKQSSSMGDVIPMINSFAGDINSKVFDRDIANDLYARPQIKASKVPNAPGALENAGPVAGSYDTGLTKIQQAGSKRFQTHLKINGQINAMAAGDVNKDGIIEIVTANDNQIYIHKFEGSKLVVIKQLDFSSTNKIVALDIADINKNGFLEIFVTSMNIHREGLQSFVLEYNGSGYTTLTDGQRYYFRVINGMDNLGLKGEKILLGQRASDHPFHGAVFTMTTSGGHYSEARRLQLPHSASVLSLAQGSLTSDDAKEYALINEHGNLVVAGSTGNIEWKSNSSFGGTAHYYLLPRSDVDASYTERVYLNPRIKFYDIEDNGKTEVFAVRNEESGGGAFGRYKRFTEGNLEILSWDGIALTPLFKIPPVQGWISDFAIADFNNDGIDELMVAVVGKEKLLINKKQQISNIISYKLK
jgi:TolB-like protein